MSSEMEMTMIERLRAIGDFASVFEAPGFSFGEWSETDPSGDVIMIPVFNTSPDVDRFVQTCNEMGWVSPEDNWPEWKDSEEAIGLRDDPVTLEHASVEQLRRILTVIIRQDRFVEGSLASHFKSELLVRVLSRAKHIAVNAQSESE